ncbi:DNA helicase UvrD [Burkholderia stabilis]|uniref:DNA 3'-5' helicase n=1 Tax=Burkholderia stabilis TaxID=95485 RepID=A0A1Y1BVC3_9BURK|nr:DNA helicase UvrD [Burkholderia stabilis]
MRLVKPQDWRPQGVDDLEGRAWDAIRETERNVLVTAGAGAGKTEFLAQKASYLLQTGICAAPKRILAISFKRDAARNLAERVAKRCTPDQARRFDSYTFDAFAKGLVDRFRAAIPEPYRPPADYRVIMPSRRDYTEFLDLREIRQINAQGVEHALARARLPIENDGDVRQRVVAEYWRTQYQDHQEVLLSFLMMNRLAEYLLRENSEILRALRLTYPFVFLDEFQDTTAAQFRLLHTAFHGSDAIFTAVGDDKQRIMLWADALPNAFDTFGRYFGAHRVALLSNWRSHEDLVRIQHIIANTIDPDVEEAEARAIRVVDGDVVAIWEIETEDDEGRCLAQWVGGEVDAGRVDPHHVAILVRMRADEVEAKLSPHFEACGLRLRNAARMVGDIAIQDLLGEDLTQIVLRLMRLGTTSRSPEHWSAALRDLQFLEAVDPVDELALQRLQGRLETFLHRLRRMFREFQPVPDSAVEMTSAILEFIGVQTLRRTFASYQRQADFDRVIVGFVLLLQECLANGNAWPEVLDDLEGIGQVALMTIHKSKGLEFHTVIFYGLDNQTWWSLRPDRLEELNSFFVAFTRAKQRSFFTSCIERGGPVNWIEDLLAQGGVQRIRMRPAMME